MAVFLSIICGIILSIMLPANGDLGTAMGLYHATVFNHATGLLIVLVILFIKRKDLVHGKRLNLIWYMGGVLGIFTVLAQSTIVPHLGVSKPLALGLLGQSITSLFIEQYGWFETPVSRLNKQKIFGLLFILAGTCVMFLY